MQQNEDYVLKVLQDVGLVTRKQIDGARKRLNGANNVVDLLIKDGIVPESDISRSLAAQAHMDWIDLSSMIIPPVVVKQIRMEDAVRQRPWPRPHVVAAGSFLVTCSSSKKAVSSSSERTINRLRDS